MKFIDVTLRDGGNQHNFNWPLEFVERYLESVISFLYFVIRSWRVNDDTLNLDH